jgi:hypothetical protein
MPTCTNGLDNDVDLGGVAACIARSGYSFVARYLGGPCYPGTPLDATEARALAAAGLLLVSIYVGANTVRTFSCGTQTDAGGTTDGAAAVRLALGVGQPAGSAIYLDLQPDQVTAEDRWLGYVQHWAAAVAAGGFTPGLYSSADQLRTVFNQPWGGGALLYWVAASISDMPIFPAPCPAQELSFATLWQYVLEIPVCGVPGMDVDSAQSTTGMWTPAQRTPPC